MSQTQREQDTSISSGGLRLLVPMDGSAQSARALEVAKRIPSSEILLLHVEQEEVLFLPEFYPVGAGELAAEARAEFERAAKSLRAEGLTVKTEIRQGDPSDEILEASAGYDLIVMATRGRNAAGRMLFGSVADRISRHSSVPALLIRARDDTPLPETTRIVVPLDGSAIAERALPIAIRLAQGLSLPVHLVRAVDIDSVRATIRARRQADDAPAIDAGKEGNTWEDARLQTEQDATAYLARIAADLESQGVTTSTQILLGTAAFELLATLQETDLAVMTSHGRSGFERWLLGSVAEKLVREAKSPVVLVPTRDDPS